MLACISTSFLIRKHLRSKGDNWQSQLYNRSALPAGAFHLYVYSVRRLGLGSFLVSLSFFQKTKFYLLDVSIFYRFRSFCIRFSRYSFWAIGICFSTIRSKTRKSSICLVEMVRFELMTPCLQGRCSPNWATPPKFCRLELFLRHFFGFLFFSLFSYRFASSLYGMGLNGLEPSTSRLSGVRSNQLSYKPKVKS